MGNVAFNATICKSTPIGAESKIVEIVVSNLLIYYAPIIK